MTAVAEPVTTFDASTYQLDVPSLDGHRAVDLRLTFSGSAALDRTSHDDIELMRAARLGGVPLRLVVVAEPSGKGFKMNRKTDGDQLGFTLTLRVVSVEVAEPA